MHPLPERRCICVNSPKDTNPQFNMYRILIPSMCQVESVAYTIGHVDKQLYTKLVS